MIPLNQSRINEGKRIIKSFVLAIDSIKLGVSFSRTVDEILKCKGKIITTGMGKAGIAMRKFTSTLCSLGFPSVYLHPGEASHGDLGLLRENDILFITSTSGKTREVMEVMQLARNINIKKIIGITSHMDSPIRKKADLIIDMGEVKEACHLGLAPTSSILVILALTDALALTASKEKGLTKEEYGRYHHGGYLGKMANGEREKL